MKEKKLYTVTDLGGGDGGKGGVVHAVSTFRNAHTILKVGGAQGCHGVSTSRGESFTFSQFGCGTFEGVRTHITPLMVIDPLRLMVEGDLLRYEKGILNVFDLLTVDEDCLCAFPYHGIASRLRELSRKENQKGTVGVGIGEAQSDFENHPELSIHVRDLSNPDIRKKIEALQDFKVMQLAQIIDNLDDLWSEDRESAQREIALLKSETFLDDILVGLKRFMSQVQIVKGSYLNKKILLRDGVIVVESSHGVLTDKYHGFHPYTSRLRTVPHRVTDLLKECNYDGEIIRVGVTRAYQIRHGAGPLVTEMPDLTEKLLPGSCKDENRMQGKVRTGPLDFVALRYAINVCGGPQNFDALAVTWFDQIQVNKIWQLCDSYDNANDPEYFSPEGEILVRRGVGDSQLQHQGQLAKKLFVCKPRIDSIEISPDWEQKMLEELCVGVLKDKLSAPVRMISFGPTEKNKAFI